MRTPKSTDVQSRVDHNPSARIWGLRGQAVNLTRLRQTLYPVMACCGSSIDPNNAFGLFQPFEFNYEILSIT